MKLEDLAKKDEYNFLSPYGLGDTMMLCGFAHAWEKKNGGKIHFIIKPSHEVVMKMYGIKNYSTFKFDLKSCKKLGDDCPEPKLGKLFVAHPVFVKTAQSILKKFENLEIDFKDLYAQFLEVDANVFKIYKRIPKMDKAFRKKVEAIAPLNKIVLLSPTANSVKAFPQSFWEPLCRQLKEKGYTVISNVINPDDAIYDTIYLPMTSDEVVALAYACDSVYSLRSGLCDIIAMRPKNLAVFYDHSNTLFLYGLNKLFNRQDIIEQVVDPYANLAGNTPLVTIVTVTYNLIKQGRQKLMVQSLESVHNQSYQNVEHIIIDGASTDGTLDFLKTYEQKGWIKIYSEKDNGIYDAMNKGINKAKGKYIAFLNSDDFYHNLDAIKWAVQRLEETGSDFAYGTTKCLDVNNVIRMFYPYKELVMTQMPFCHQSLFCKKSLLEKERFDTQFKLAADYDLILRCFLKNYKRAQIDAEIATYRMDGLSGSRYEDCVADYKRVYRKNYGKLIPEKYYDDMIRHNIVPEQLKKKFRKVFPNRHIRISLFGIPFFCVIQTEFNMYINLFKWINLVRIENKNKMTIYVYLFSVLKCIKINLKK